MPTPEQCDAASSSWGRAAPHWLTDKITRRETHAKKVAWVTASWRSGGFSQHQIMPKAALDL